MNEKARGQIVYSMTEGEVMVEAMTLATQFIEDWELAGLSKIENPAVTRGVTLFLNEFVAACFDAEAERWKDNPDSDQIREMAATNLNRIGFFFTALVRFNGFKVDSLLEQRPEFPHP